LTTSTHGKKFSKKIFKHFCTHQRSGYSRLPPLDGVKKYSFWEAANKEKLLT